MKSTVLLSVLALGASAFAANNGFRVHLSQDSQIEGKTVKAGDYRISVENGNAILKQGRQSIEVPAHEQTVATKVPSTQMYYKDNNTVLHSIKVGGTNTEIVFDGAGQAQPGA